MADQISEKDGEDDVWEKGLLRSGLGQAIGGLGPEDLFKFCGDAIQRLFVDLKDGQQDGVEVEIPQNFGCDPHNMSRMMQDHKLTAMCNARVFCNNRLDDRPRYDLIHLRQAKNHNSCGDELNRTC